MEIGIDSFAAVQNSNDNTPQGNALALSELLKRIEYADQVGLDVFGIGEHYRKDFLDSAPAVILAAAASRTKRIKLVNAVAVLSVADPVRTFQSFSTLDLLTEGRAELVVGRGSFTESFPLFGYSLNDYDDLFREKLDLLLQIRDEEQVTWSGKFRPAIKKQAVYPRPFQKKLPVWLGVGGSPDSFVRAGSLGLPLMVAIIGGETHRFKPLVDMYREAGEAAGFMQDELIVGVHSPGYIADSTEKAIEEYYPGYVEFFGKIGRERGWPTITKSRFLEQNNKEGALIVASPEEAAEKINHHSKVLGGISRFTFQMDNAGLSHQQLMNSIKLIGTKVKPLIV